MWYHCTGPLDKLPINLIFNLKELIVDKSSRNPHLALITGDFNANSTNWSVDDPTTSEGAQFDSLISMCRLKQLIGELTHILENSSSCIDLIFTSQPSIVMNIHLTLHSEYHHQIICSKLNVNIEYPSPHTREIWDYNRTETDLVNRAIESFDQPKLDFGENIHKQVILLANNPGV